MVRNSDKAIVISDNGKLGVISSSGHFELIDQPAHHYSALYRVPRSNFTIASISVGFVVLQDTTIVDVINSSGTSDHRPGNFDPQTGEILFRKNMSWSLLRGFIQHSLSRKALSDLSQTAPISGAEGAEVAGDTVSLPGIVRGDWIYLNKCPDAKQDAFCAVGQVISPTVLLSSGRTYLGTSRGLLVKKQGDRFENAVPPEITGDVFQIDHLEWADSVLIQAAFGYFIFSEDEGLSMIGRFGTLERAPIHRAFVAPHLERIFFDGVPYKLSPK